MKLTRKQKSLLYTNDGKMRSSVQRAIDVLNVNGVFRPVETGFRNRHGTVRDITYDVFSLLRALKLKYKTGNDAPRGGLSGYYIKISGAAVTKIRNLKKNIKL